jgi:hypothetical protein
LGVERRCELLLCLKSRAESIEGVHLVIWTSKNSNGAVFDCNHGLRGSMSGVPTAGTGDAARWLMLEKLRRVDGGMPADAGELLEMVLTADEWDREMVHEQKRKRITPARGQRRLTGITPNRWVLLRIGCLSLYGIRWRHSEYAPFLLWTGK